MENQITRLAILKIDVTDIYGLGSISSITQQAGVRSMKLVHSESKMKEPPKCGELVFLEHISVDYSMEYPSRYQLKLKTKDGYVVEIECHDYEPILQFIPETPAALVLFYLTHANILVIS